jgi:predicted small integral membrane protein
MGLVGMDWAWMAWTWQTAVFFCVIAMLLGAMTMLAIWWPETPRLGVLRIPTTRGDRLFVSLLGTAFINLLWLGTVGPGLYWALLLSLLYAAAVFRWV